MLFFIPALIAGSFKDQENKAKRPVYILGAAGIICYVAGMLFKIQHWPLAMVIMGLGVIILGFVALPWYTWLTWKDNSHISARFIFFIIGSLLIIVPGALINLNLQNSYDYGFYSHLEQLKTLYIYKYSNNQALMNQHRDSSDFKQMEELHSRTDKLLILIGNIETKMVAESEGKPGMPALSQAQISQTESGSEIQYKLLSKPFNTAPARDFLLPGSKSRQELNAALTEYINFMPGLSSGIP